MRLARAAHAAGGGLAAAGAGEICGASTCHAGGKGGELLFEARGTALGAEGSLPIARADQDFAVLVARFAVKFVNRHGVEISRPAFRGNGVGDTDFTDFHGFRGSAPGMRSSSICENP